MKQGTMNILFFPLKTKVLKNGEAPILLRVTIDGQYDEVRIQRSARKIRLLVVSTLALFKLPFS